MSNIQDRIMEYLGSKKLSDRELSTRIGLSHGYLGSVRKGTVMGLDKVEKILDTFEDLNKLWVFTGAGSMTSEEKSYKEITNNPHFFREEEPAPYIVTVDQSGRDNITFVNVRARAGYLSGFGDPEYVSELPAYRLPGFNNGTFRAFEVEGDSMYQYQTRSGLVPGSWVIAERVDHPVYIRDSRVYVIVSTEGIIIKRCINRLKAEEPILICQSDNKSGEYSDILLYPDQITEVWEFKAVISRHIPPPSDIYKAVIDLQADMAIIKNKLKD